MAQVMLVAWRYQAITSTYVDFSLVKFENELLRLLPYLPGTDELSVELGLHLIQRHLESADT